MTGFARRVGASLAACSAVLHGFSLGGGLPTTLLMTAMIVGCLYCAYELWTDDSVRAWVLVALMNLAMIGVHLPMTGEHHHGSVVLPHAALTTITVATGVAVLEVVLAVGVLFHRTRRPQLT